MKMKKLLLLLTLISCFSMFGTDYYDGMLDACRDDYGVDPLAVKGAAGLDTQIQYNNSGAFGGISGFTYSGSTVICDSSLTLDIANLKVVNTIDEFSTDGTLAGDSDDAVPTEKAVKTYVDNLGLTSLTDVNSAAITAGQILMADGTDYESVDFDTQVVANSEVIANTAKITNVSTELSVGTVGANTVAITSDGGADDVTLPAATISTAGMLTTAKWGEIVANTAKVTNVSTDLSEGTSTETTVDINSSDGNNATLVSASTTRAGLLTKAKFDEIVANNAKLTADTTNVTNAGALMDSEVDADIKTLVLPALTTISAFGSSIVNDADAPAVRSTIGVDVAGTDNSTDVTLSGIYDYMSLVGQQLTMSQIALDSEVTGDLPISNISGTAGTNKQFLQTDGTDTAWADAVGGSDTQIQYNNSGVLNGIDGFYYSGNTIACDSPLVMDIENLKVVNTITEFSTDGTLAGDSDTAIPTEKAVKTYVDEFHSYGELAIISNTTATVIRGTDEWQALTANVIEGLNENFTYVAGSLGEIASIADAGGGDITVTDIGHGLSSGDFITQNGCTESEYNGIFEVKSVPTADTYTVTATYTATDTGYWQQGASLTCNKTGIYRGSWTSCGTSATNAHVFQFTPCINTTTSTKALSQRKFSNADIGSFSGGGLMSITSGDVIHFLIKNITATGNITILTLDLNLVLLK